MPLKTLDILAAETAPDFTANPTRDIKVYWSGSPGGQNYETTAVQEARDPGSREASARASLDWLAYDLPAARPPIQPRTRRFIATARWEGVVTERFDTYFEAEVIDLDVDESATAQFDLDDLSYSDRRLCEPGALFYWSIGYDVKDGGQRSRSSVIAFRRLGPGRGSDGE